MDNYLFLDEYRQNGGEYIIPDGVHNTLLIDIENLQQENKKYKEVIDRAIKYIDLHRDYQDVHKQIGINKYEDVREDILFEENIDELLDILKEVE